MMMPKESSWKMNIMVQPVTSMRPVGSVIWALDALISKLTGRIEVTGWTMMFIFQLLSFGITMLTLGLLGAYLWRTFDASRRRPPYLIEIADGQKARGRDRQEVDG